MFDFKDHRPEVKTAKKRKFLSTFHYKFWPAIFITFPVMGQSGDISIRLKNLKKDKGGSLITCLFNKESGFPDDGRKAVKILKSGLQDEIIIPEIPNGRYALVVLHDTDKDGKMTYSFFGLPKDGFSSSPDGGSAFKKPEFQQCLFFHEGKQSRLELKVHYIP